MLHQTVTAEAAPEAIPALARGWTQQLKAKFLDHLAVKGNVRASCARVDLSTESAYRLRRRDPDFARGWAAALALARDASVQVLADRAIDGVEERVFYKGELIDTRRRYDSRLLLAHIARLDKLVDEEAVGPDAARFDELLARIAGEDVPVFIQRTTACSRAIATAWPTPWRSRPSANWTKPGARRRTERSVGSARRRWRRIAPSANWPR